MFNVIRLPTKFSRTINRFSQKDKSELLDMLIQIGDGNKIIVPDTIVGDTLSLIYGEWMNMESKNGNKPKSSLINHITEGEVEPCPSESGARVEESIIEENIIDISSDIVIAPKVATKNLQELIKDTFDTNFIKDLDNKYGLSETEFKEQANLFYLHWSEKSPNGKKEHWQKEKTFDPKLRFYKWLSNNKKWSKPQKYENHTNIESVFG